jgi:membrane protease subunit HflC
VLGKYELLNVVSNDGEMLRIDEIESEMLENVKTHALELYGISVSEIGVMKISLPEENLRAAFDKITQERQNLITEITTEAQTEAAKITYQADLDAAKIIADAIKEAAATDAETQKLVAQIYADAQNGEMTEELFKFIMELDTVINSVGSDTTLVIQKGELLDGLFSEELLQLVKQAQANTGLSGTTNTESNVNE